MGVISSICTKQLNKTKQNKTKQNKTKTALKNKETSPSVVMIVVAVKSMELQNQGMENHAYTSLQKDYETVNNDGIL